MVVNLKYNTNKLYKPWYICTRAFFTLVGIRFSDLAGKKLIFLSVSDRKTENMSTENKTKTKKVEATVGQDRNNLLEELAKLRAENERLSKLMECKEEEDESEEEEEESDEEEESEEEESEDEEEDEKEETEDGDEWEEYEYWECCGHELALDQVCPDCKSWFCNCEYIISPGAYKRAQKCKECKYWRCKCDAVHNNRKKRCPCGHRMD